MTLLCTLSCDVAGVRHANPDFRKLEPRSPVLLVPEPTNEYDAAAIRVDHPVVGKLGYIPRGSTYGLHTNRAAGHPGEAFILTADFSKRQIQIGVFVEV